MKATSETVLRIRPVGHDMIVATWTDSALYNTTAEVDELLLDDAALEAAKQADAKHKIRSQAGAIVGVFSRKLVESLEKIPLSVLDWRTRATKRVVTSTFAAESSAAADGLGLGLYVRALLAEIYHGIGFGADRWGEDVMPTMLITDCKSLYDHMVKDATLPDDRWTALYIAALRGAVSAGIDRDLSKTEMRWVPSRSQLADVMTKTGLADRAREVMMDGAMLLHEVSAQQLKRDRGKG